MCEGREGRGRGGEREREEIVDGVCVLMDVSKDEPISSTCNCLPATTMIIITMCSIWGNLH